MNIRGCKKITEERRQKQNPTPRKLGLFAGLSLIDASFLIYNDILYCILRPLKCIFVMILVGLANRFSFVLRGHKQKKFPLNTVVSVLPTGGRIHTAIKPLSQTQDSRASPLLNVPDTESVLRKQDQPYWHGQGPHPQSDPYHGQEHLSGWVINT